LVGQHLHCGVRGIQLINTHRHWHRVAAWSDSICTVAYAAFNSSILIDIVTLMERTGKT
ncbi:hypothetical protein BaRGS_00012542, partial [Batillaria attramentaria]